MLTALNLPLTNHRMPSSYALLVLISGYCLIQRISGRRSKVDSKFVSWCSGQNRCLWGVEQCLDALLHTCRDHQWTDRTSAFAVRLAAQERWWVQCDPMALKYLNSHSNGTSRFLVLIPNIGTGFRGWVIVVELLGFLYAISSVPEERTYCDQSRWAGPIFQQLVPLPCVNDVFHQCWLSRPALPTYPKRATSRRQPVSKSDRQLARPVRVIEYTVESLSICVLNCGAITSTAKI